MFKYWIYPKSHSSTLSWKIPWTEDLIGCTPWGYEELDTTERIHFHFSLSCIGEGNETHSSVLAWRIPGTGEPGGLLSMGSRRVGHDWSDSAASAVLNTLQILTHWIFIISLSLQKKETKHGKRRWSKIMWPVCGRTWTWSRTALLQSTHLNTPPSGKSVVTGIHGPRVLTFHETVWKNTQQLVKECW